ncbi:HAD family hydrolase [Saccharopolyspora sp. 6V]|nr:MULTISPECIES: HAD family hydrolase [unclassified Saccharopolyspora]MCA1186446.1 HAD family hydrolase [Saccharopolyspora sp. 6T]MCA1193561.1 HAD family hydrolase [Saccharopolyspora sp. 6V]MCA1227549.1 HAD family hydrolase [Saccharopolyspora sp. 6M]MCA1280074.1 HAD family hydrolase [Saccharopolyspora sp. 7B]
MNPATVGFDLDLTLIDPRPGMVDVFERLRAEFGVPLDGEHFAANLGPPLPDVLRTYGFDEPLVASLVHRFRELYPELVVPGTKAMPGAAESLAAVRELGGRALVVTGKFERNARLHLDALGWEVDRLAGDVFAAAKGDVLLAEGAAIYVGDHLGDVVGAKTAGALAVGVATGPYRAEELLEAGADVALGDLAEFPAWLAGRAG